MASQGEKDCKGALGRSLVEWGNRVNVDTKPAYTDVFVGFHQSPYLRLFQPSLANEMLSTALEYLRLKDPPHSQVPANGTVCRRIILISVEVHYIRHNSDRRALDTSTLCHSNLRWFQDLWQLQRCQNATCEQCRMSLESFQCCRYFMISRPGFSTPFTTSLKVICLLGYYFDNGS